MAPGCPVAGSKFVPRHPTPPDFSGGFFWLCSAAISISIQRISEHALKSSGVKEKWPRPVSGSEPLSSRDLPKPPPFAGRARRLLFRNFLEDCRRSDKHDHEYFDRHGNHLLSNVLTVGLLGPEELCASGRDKKEAEAASNDHTTFLPLGSGGVS